MRNEEPYENFDGERAPLRPSWWCKRAERSARLWLEGQLGDAQTAAVVQVGGARRGAGGWGGEPMSGWEGGKATHGPRRWFRLAGRGAKKWLGGREGDGQTAVVVQVGGTRRNIVVGREGGRRPDRRGRAGGRGGTLSWGWEGGKATYRQPRWCKWAGRGAKKRLGG